MPGDKKMKGDARQEHIKKIFKGFEASLDALVPIEFMRGIRESVSADFFYISSQDRFTELANLMKNSVEFRELLISDNHRAFGKQFLIWGVDSNKNQLVRLKETSVNGNTANLIDECLREIHTVKTAPVASGSSAVLKTQTVKEAPVVSSFSEVLTSSFSAVLNSICEYLKINPVNPTVTVTIVTGPDGNEIEHETKLTYVSKCPNSLSSASVSFLGFDLFGYCRKSKPQVSAASTATAAAGLATVAAVADSGVDEKHVKTVTPPTPKKTV